jgi:predicted AlkP superfamily pyrophosphatase or phosphodiesterase
MSSRVCVIDLPGLSKDLLQYVPTESALGKWMVNKPVVTLNPSWPAVTCSVQATLTTGLPPSQHGIIANGIPTFRSIEDQAMVDTSNFAEYRKQISFWEQSNQFVQVPRFWQDSSGNSKIKTALLFFQHCMPGFHGTPKPAADIVLTPKPDHGPDGKLTSLCWSNPAELVPMLFKELGFFPLMNYWGPLAGIPASVWIAKAAAIVWATYSPQLQMTYVPHLDYDLQRFGPRSEQAKKAVMDVANALDPLIDAVLTQGGKLVVLSEYSIANVTRSIPINQMLKAAGLLKTHSTPDGDLIDYDRSDAVAMVDHQIAHIYVRAGVDDRAVREAFASEPSLEIADKLTGINHPRAGDLQLHAATGTWFDYRWWDKSEAAPVFASTVDIHRKPGYDPLELFLEPGTRTITNDHTLIKGSHGSVPGCAGVLIGTSNLPGTEMTDVAGQILSLLEQ